MGSRDDEGHADDHGLSDTLPRAEAPSQLDTEPAGLVGRTLLNRYEVQRALARGGMGAVYVARDRSLKVDVAVKALDARQAMVDPAELERRFKREAEAIANLKNNHIVRIIELGRTEDNQLFMVTELLDGVPLDQALLDPESREPVRLDADRVLKIMIETCRALAEAHAVGIIHRDIKPGNIFLARDRAGEESTKVLDFGIAKIAVDGEIGSTSTDVPTRAGATIGTVAYMSPEQAGSKPVVPQSDLYALGVVAYHCLTGHRPFTGDLQTVLIAHLMRQPPPFEPEWGIDERLEALVLRLLSKDPLDRAPDARSLREELERLQADLRTPGKQGASVVHRPSSRSWSSEASREAVPGAETGPHSSRRRTTAWAWTAGLGIVVSIGAWVLAQGLDGPSDNEIRTQQLADSAVANPPISPDDLEPTSADGDQGSGPKEEPAVALASGDPSTAVPKSSHPPSSEHPREADGLAKKRPAATKLPEPPSYVLRSYRETQVNVPAVFRSSARACGRQMAGMTSQVTITVADGTATVIAKDQRERRDANLERCLNRAALGLSSEGPLGVLSFELVRQRTGAAD